MTYGKEREDNPQLDDAQTNGTVSATVALFGDTLKSKAENRALITAVCEFQEGQTVSYNGIATISNSRINSTLKLALF